eukprot:CFRG1916T1
MVNSSTVVEKPLSKNDGGSGGEHMSNTASVKANSGVQVSVVPTAVDVETNVDMAEDIDDDVVSETAEEQLERTREQIVLWYKNTHADTIENTLKSLVLKRVVKESHEQEIKDMCFNFATPNCSNILATVGGQQANIYDSENTINQYDENSHLDGSHVDILLQHVGAEDQQLLTCSWIGSEHGDAVLAIGGTEEVIRVLSMGRVAEIAVLRGHEGSINFLVGHHERSGLIISGSKNDKTVRMWYLSMADGTPSASAEYTNHCVSVHTFKTSPTCVAISPDGQHALVGTTTGEIVKLPIPLQDSDIVRAAAPAAIFTLHKSAIDSIFYLDHRTVLSKSTDIHTLKWSIESAQEIDTIIKPIKFGVKGGYCRFDVSSDKRFLCMGNEDGEVLVYSLETKALITRLKHPRIKQMRVMSCGFTADMRKIVCVTEKSYLFRYDYVDPRIIDEWNRGLEDDDDSDDMEE